MDGVRLSRSPTGISRSLTPQAKAAAHQHQQSINYRPLQSSDMIKQLLVTAAIATSQDPKPSPSEARDSRLNEPAAIHIARPEFPPGPTITIGPSCRNVPTAPTGAAKPNIAPTTGSSGSNQMLPTSSLRLNDNQILHDSYDGAEASPATSSWTNDGVDMLTETNSLGSAAASSDTSRETSHSPPTATRRSVNNKRQRTVSGSPEPASYADYLKEIDALPADALPLCEDQYVNVESIWSCEAGEVWTPMTNTAPDAKIPPENIHAEITNLQGQDTFQDNPSINFDGFLDPIYAVWPPANNERQALRPRTLEAELSEADFILENDSEEIDFEQQYGDAPSPQPETQGALAVPVVHHQYTAFQMETHYQALLRGPGGDTKSPKIPEKKHIQNCVDLMGHLGTMAADDQLLHCEASGVYQQLGQRMSEIYHNLPAKTVLAQKLNSMWEPSHAAGTPPRTLTQSAAVTLDNWLNVENTKDEVFLLKKPKIEQYNHALQFIASMGKLGGCQHCQKVIPGCYGRRNTQKIGYLAAISSNLHTASAGTLHTASAAHAHNCTRWHNASVEVALTVTDLTVFHNYMLVMLALVGITSLVIITVTSLLPASEGRKSSIASLRYEALRLDDHLKRLREAEGQNNDTMDRQANAIRIANTKLSRLQDLLLARERRMQSHLTTVFGHHSAPAASDNLELPAPIRVQVIPESKAGKSATIVQIENANPDTLQFAAFKSEIYNLTGLKPEEQRYQILRDGKMTAMQALPTATASHVSNTDEAIESILNNHIDIETEPETEPGVQPSLLDLGFVTLTEAGYQPDRAGHEFDIRLLAKLKGGLPRTRSAEAALAKASAMEPPSMITRTRSGRAATQAAATPLPSVTPRSPSRRAVITPDSDSSEDGHDSERIEAPATPSGAALNPMIPGSAPTPKQNPRDSYLRKLTRCSKRIQSHGLDIEDPAVLVEVHMRLYHAVMESIERTCESPPRPRALCAMLYHPANRLYHRKALRALEKRAVQLDPPALRVFVDDIAKHYQNIAEDILKPQAEDKNHWLVPGEAYPCHLCAGPAAVESTDQYYQIACQTCCGCIIPDHKFSAKPGYTALTQLVRSESIEEEEPVLPKINEPVSFPTSPTEGDAAVSDVLNSIVNSIVNPAVTSASPWTDIRHDQAEINEAAEKEKQALNHPLPITPAEPRPARSRHAPERFAPSPNAVRQESISNASLDWLQTSVSSTNSSKHQHSESEDTGDSENSGGDEDPRDPNAHMLTKEDSSFVKQPSDSDDNSDDSISLSEPSTDNSCKSHPDYSSNQSTPLRQSKITEFLTKTPPSRDTAAKERLATLQNPDGSPVYLDPHLSSVQVKDTQLELDLNQHKAEVAETIPSIQPRSATSLKSSIESTDTMMSVEYTPEPETEVIDLDQELTPPTVKAPLQFHEEPERVDLTQAENRTATKASDEMQTLHHLMRNIGYTEIDSDDEIIPYHLPCKMQESHPPCGLHGCNDECKVECVAGTNAVQSFCSAEHQAQHRRDMEQDPLLQPKWQVDTPRHSALASERKAENFRMAIGDNSAIYWDEHQAMDWLIENIDSPALIEAAIQLKPTGCDLLTFSSWRTLGRLAGLTESLSTTDAHSMQMHLRFTRQNAIQIKHTPMHPGPPSPAGIDEPSSTLSPTAKPVPPTPPSSNATEARLSQPSPAVLQVDTPTPPPRVESVLSTTDSEGVDINPSDESDAEVSPSQSEHHGDSDNSDSEREESPSENHGDNDGSDPGLNLSSDSVQMYCHLIVPLNRSAEQCTALSQTPVNEWLEVLASESDEITSTDPTQGIVLLTKKTGYPRSIRKTGRHCRDAQLLVPSFKQQPVDESLNGPSAHLECSPRADTIISDDQSPRFCAQSDWHRVKAGDKSFASSPIETTPPTADERPKRTRQLYLPTYDWEWQLPSGSCPTSDRDRRIFFESVEFEKFINSGRQNRWGTRCQVLHYDSTSQTVHVAIILTAPQAAAIADITELGPYVPKPRLIDFSDYFQALQISPNVQFEGASGRYLGHQIKMLIRSMAPHIATVPETQSSRTMTRVDLDQTTAMQPYAHRNLFENEKSLIDRMVATLKQLLEHVRPYGPDELDYVPFTEFNGFDDILYDVYFQGILDITQDDAITSRNQSDQRRIMHTIILRTLSKQKLIQTDPQSSPWLFWNDCQRRYASQKRMQGAHGFSKEAWMPIGSLTSTDDSYTTPETGEIDNNKGGVALLKERFPLRSVPAYMFTAVEGFRITQFVDIDEIQARFNKQLKVLEDTQRRFPLVETEGGRPGNQRQCSTWSTANSNALNMKIEDIIHQVSAMYEREVKNFNESRLTTSGKREPVPKRGSSFLSKILRAHGHNLLDRDQEIIWDDLKFYVTEATFERRDTEGQLEEPIIGSGSGRLKLMDYLEKHKIWVPGRHFSPVPLSQKWTQYIATQDRCDTGSGAPTEYSYVSTLRKSKARGTTSNTGHKNKKSKYNPKSNGAAAVLRISNGANTADPVLQFPVTPRAPAMPVLPRVSVKVHRQAVRLVESVPLPDATTPFQCTEDGIKQSALNSFVMALYQNDQEAPARIRSLIGQAIGSDAALVNDVLLSAHNERTDRSRKKDFEAGPARDAAGKVQWSDNSTNLMRALRLRTLFMMGELDIKEITPLEKKWAFTEYDHIKGVPNCTLCGSKKHTMVECPDFNTKTRPWKKGGELYAAYKQKWARTQHSSTQAQQRGPASKSGGSRPQGPNKKFEPSRSQNQQSFR